MSEHPELIQDTQYSQSQLYTRDGEFFINVRPLYLRAENTLYCVPRHYFEASEVFDGMFSLPEGPNYPAEGSSEESPLFLESIKADELKDFLCVLTCRWAINDNLKPEPKPASWVSVLKLASLWQFSLLREKALRNLKNEDSMTRLLVARQYGMDDWFIPALKEVAMRAKPLTVDEITQLGLEFSVKVIALRETARGAGMSGLRVQLEEYHIHRIFGERPNASA